MRIAVYCPHYEDASGVQQVVRRLSAGMVARGHTLAVLARRSSAAGGGGTDPVSGAPLWRARFQRAPYRGEGLRAYRRFVRRFPASALALVRHLRRFEPEVIATHCSRFYVPYLLAMRASVRAPIVVHLHGGARTAAGPESLLLSRLLLRCARRVLAVSPAVAAYAHACLPAAAGRVVAVGNGVDADEFAGLPPVLRERPYVLGIGRLSEEKGFDLLIEGLAGASTEFELLLAGEGPERPRLERQARQRGVAARVHLLGHVDRATLGRLLRGAAMVVLPSRAEGAPLVCQEAMLAGAPLIATDLPAYPPEVRHGETAVLVPPGDVRALARALSELAAAPARARALGEAAREAARRFPSWNDVTERILAEYKRVVDGNAAEPRPEPGVGGGSTR